MGASQELVVPAPVPLGYVVGGKYRVDRVLGVGGMGVVVEAYHLRLLAPVAIKFLLPQIAGNGEVRERFLREARAAIQIHSEHVARVLDVDTLENGTPYMVMEYLEGKDLAGVLEENGRLSADQAVSFMQQACEALAEAHAIGIVHRDLKPANIFLTRRRSGALSIKVLDFGVSKLSTTVDRSSMTRADSMMGSPLYMPPEQFVSAKNADARSDVWSLGVILYELLAGVPPFREESLLALCRQVTEDEPLPLAAHRSDLPSDLVRIVSVCLAKDPARRYQSIDALNRDLARVARRLASTGSRSTGAPTSAPPPSELTGTTSPRTLGGVATTNRASGSRPWVRAGLALGIFGLLAVAGLLARGLLRGNASTTDSGTSLTARTLPEPPTLGPEAQAQGPRPLAPKAHAQSQSSAAGATADSPGTQPSAIGQPTPAGSAAPPPSVGLASALGRASPPSPTKPTPSNPGGRASRPLSSVGASSTPKPTQSSAAPALGAGASPPPKASSTPHSSAIPASLEELGSRRH